ncbi:Intracellular Vesicle Transport-Associated [Abortiporus biennis]
MSKQSLPSSEDNISKPTTYSMTIPRASQRSAVTPSYIQNEDNLQSLVGSPDQFTIHDRISMPPQAHGSSSETQGSTTPRNSRPGLVRSVSTPYTTSPPPTSNLTASMMALPESLPTSASTPRSKAGRLPISISSVFKSPQSHRREDPPQRHQEREWSVFGSLMSNEGFTPGTIRGTLGTSVGALRTPTTSVSGSMVASAESTFIGWGSGVERREGVPRNWRDRDRVEEEEEEEERNSRRQDSISSLLSSASTESTSTERGRVLGESSSPVSPSIPAPTLTIPRTSPQQKDSGGFFTRLFPKLSIPALTPLQRNVLKCAIAYFIGSLFTFSPYLSGFISDLTNYNDEEGGGSTPSPSGHMVATIAVYFNPAKTYGAMLEADKFCFMGLLFASKDNNWVADLVVILLIGIGMSCVAWMKLWMAKPSFNTACSMTAILLFVVVVKEGGLETLLQVTLIVFIGSTISNVLCYTLWPQRATTNLQVSMVKTLDSFSTLLTLMTKTFLLEEKQRGQGKKVEEAVKSHQESFTALKKNLGEAKGEGIFGNGAPSNKEPPVSFMAAGGHYYHPITPTSSSEHPLPNGTSSDGGDNGWGEDEEGQGKTRNTSVQAYTDAIDSLNRLGQHLNGLRSGTSLQMELVQAEKEGRLVLKNHKDKGKQKTQPGHGSMSQGESSNTFGSTSGDVEGDDDTLLLQAAADMFGELVDDVGPPLKSLSTTCSTTLKRLRESFQCLSSPTPSFPLDAGEFRDLADTVERALFTFESTSNHAILRLYRSRTGDGLGEEGDNQMVIADGSGETVFLVYFFIFTLQEFAKELVSLVDAMGRICSIQRAEVEYSRSRKWWRWGPLRWISRLWKPGDSDEDGDEGERKLLRGNTRRRLKEGIQRRISTYFLHKPAHASVSFPKIRPHAPNTVQTPALSDLSFTGRLKARIWAFGARLRENDMKYAIKTGMATAILAAPAFYDKTRPIFTEYRGEWALISFFVVISPTIGATNFMGLHRVLGTLLGAVTAVSVWSLFPENPYVLSVFGFLYSLPCFYYIVSKPMYATSARFVLLTYNLTCLYCYNTRQADISVVSIALHRFTAVTVGVVWAGIVSRYWWPTEARRELSKALGDFCLNIGWLYTRLVNFNSFASEESEYVLSGNEHDEQNEREQGAVEGTSLLAPITNVHINQGIRDFMAMELHLQIKLIELQGLLAHTQHEPRLKGPFPVKLYRSILTSLQTILDKLHSMRCVTAREEWHTTVKTEFIIPVNRERREMVGNVILYFYILASAFRLKSPLPPYLPPAENSRQQLVNAIRNLDVIRNRNVKGSRQLLFFAYALTMQGVIHELDYLGKTLQDAFGVIGGSREAFETLFAGRCTILSGLTYIFLSYWIKNWVFVSNNSRT